MADEDLKPTQGAAASTATLEPPTPAEPKPESSGFTAAVVAHQEREAARARERGPNSVRGTEIGNPESQSRPPARDPSGKFLPAQQKAEPAPAEQAATDETETPAAPDYSDLLKQVNGLPREALERIIREQKDSPLAQVAQAEASRMSQRANDERQKADLARQAAQAQIDRQNEIKSLRKLAREGDYEARQKLDQLEEEQELRENLLADNEFLGQAFDRLLQHDDVTKVFASRAVNTFLDGLMEHEDVAKEIGREGLAKIVYGPNLDAGDGAAKHGGEMLERIRIQAGWLNDAEVQKALKAARADERTKLHQGAPRPDLSPSEGPAVRSAIDYRNTPTEKLFALGLQEEEAKRQRRASA